MANRRSNPPVALPVAVAVFLSCWTSQAVGLRSQDRPPGEAPESVHLWPNRINFVWNARAHSSAGAADVVQLAARPNASTVSFYKGFPFTIHNAEGLFGGAQFFIDALLKDLDAATIEEVSKCHHRLRGDLAVPPGAGRSLWIIVNGEAATGESAIRRVMASVGPEDVVLLLGNLWTPEEPREIVRLGRFTSMWLPFASLSFAERRQHTPMDLLHRERIHFTKEKKGTLAYMHRTCSPPRELAFDDLNDELLSQHRMPASVLGICNGSHSRRLKNKPFVNKDGDNCPQNCSEFDRAVGRYEDFQFVLALEAHPNSHGYITEKAVNAFLAGSVPIASSDARMAEVFNPEAYVHMDASRPFGRFQGVEAFRAVLTDPDAYERMRRKEAVSDESLKKFFSWHPAVWETHGDDLRKQIWTEIKALCNSMW